MKTTLFLILAVLTVTGCNCRQDRWTPTPMSQKKIESIKAQAAAMERAAEGVVFRPTVIVP